MSLAVSADLPGAENVVLVIPAWNEVESIGRVVMEASGWGVSRVIVSDGGSTDGTQAAARAAGAEVVDPGRGYGRACLLGAEAAEPQDIIVFMDGDGADDPAMIPALVEPVRAGRCDFVIGSRTRGPREAGSMSIHQVAAGRVLGLAMQALYRVTYTDMCAFRAIRRDTLLGLDMREMTYGWNLEMQMRAARASLRVLEIPVPCRNRIGGASKVSGSLKGTLRAGSRILGTFARVASERSSPRALTP